VLTKLVAYAKGNVGNNKKKLLLRKRLFATPSSGMK